MFVVSTNTKNRVGIKCIMPCFSIQKNSCLFVEGNNKTCYVNSKEN